jgi:1-phosphofructokinase family hexose kinase
VVELTNRLDRKVVTITLNPVLDKTLWVKDFTAGGTFQVDRSEDVAGGKGVNVSRALKTMGFDSIASGLMAMGLSAPYIQLMDRDMIAHDFLMTEGNLRMNITVVSGGQRRETHLRERGPLLREELLPELEKKLKAMNSIDTLFVFAGSLPRGLPHASYHRLIKLLKSWGSHAVLDSSGPSLVEGLKAQPFFIKPNSQEVQEALGIFPETSEELIRAVELFHRMGIENVMITLGKNGAVLSQGRKVVHARVSVERPVNSVGSGDAALAGSIAGMLSELGTEDTARFACAMGAANTLVSGACVFHKEDVLRLMEEVNVQLL